MVSTDGAEASARYRKRKATEVEKTQKDLDWARMQLHLLESDRDRLVLENAKVQRRVDATLYEFELFKSKVRRNTALGHALEEVKKENYMNKTLHAENFALKAASAFHAENARRLTQVNLQQHQTLVLMAIRQQQGRRPVTLERACSERVRACQATKRVSNQSGQHAAAGWISFFALSPSLLSLYC